MNNRRSSIEVIADVPRLGQAGKTEIMYSANLSHRQLGQYLTFLSSRGFIRQTPDDGPKTTFAVTSAGEDPLRNLEGVLSQLSLRNLD